MTTIDFGVGKMSWFGSASDTGMKNDEGLALIEPGDLIWWWFDSMFMPGHPSIADIIKNNLGLGHLLNPNAFYAAMRWDYTKTSRSVLRKSFLKVKNPQNDLWLLVRPVDEGPAVDTGRLIDLSPGALTALGISTDDEVEVELYLP